MKIGIPQWQGRVSPVFDVAGRLLLVTVDNHREVTREAVALHAEEPKARAAEVADLGVNLLVCGALSRPLEAALGSAGIEIRPRICGDVESVLAACLAPEPDLSPFDMPGCCQRRRQTRRQGRGPGRRGRGGNAMPGF